MDYKQVGARIRTLRKERQITQKDLAAAINRSESSIAKYEQGLTEIPNSVLFDIAKVLAVDGATLLGVQSTAPQPFSVAFKWLEALGYNVVVYEEEEYRSVILRDVNGHKDHRISDKLLHELVDNVESYGKPEDNFETIGLMWGAYLRAANPQLKQVEDIDFITPGDVAAMMALLKIARMATGSKEDNFVDLAGYAACAGEIAGGTA